VADGARRDSHAPYRDTFLVPALVATVSRLSEDLRAAHGADAEDALRADLDAIYGEGVGAHFLAGAEWRGMLASLPDGCACCEPAYTPVYDAFERAADVASRLVSDGLLQRLFGVAPVSAPQWAEALKKWLARTKAPLPMVAIVASAAMDLAVPPDRRGAPAAEKLHSAVDRLVKGRGLGTWPAVVEAIGTGWQASPLLWPLLLAAEDSVNAFDAALRRAETAAKEAREAADAAEKALAKAERRPAETEADPEALRAAEARIRELEEQLAAARREVAEARAKASRLQLAIERSEREAAEAAAADAEAAEPSKPAEAVQRPEPPPAPAPEPEDPFPLRGERILLFTNQEREGVRAEQAASLEALGATVTVYFNKSLRTRGPESYPADAVVVNDLSFQPHAKADEVKRRAKRSGSRYVEGRFGSGGLARAVVEYVVQQRKREAARGA
jgi:hypothetical protein